MWTKKGQLFVIAGSLSLFGGLMFSNMVLVILGFLLLSLVIISAMIKIFNEIVSVKKGVVGKDELTYRGVKFTRRLSSYQMMEDSKTSVRLYIENPSRTTKRFELLDTLPEKVGLFQGKNSAAITIPRRDNMVLDYQIDVPIKGFFQAGPIRIRETDICQFFYDEKALNNLTDFKVYPNLSDVKEVKLRSKMPKLYAGTTIINKPGQGTEFYSVRDYVPGDSYRDINWPAYARTRKLMVNEHEMEAVIELTILLDYRAITETGKVIMNTHLASARAAASLASYFVRRRDKVGLGVYNDKVKYIHRDAGAKHLNRLNNHITGEDVKGDLPLGAVVNTIIGDIQKGMPVVIISTLEKDSTAYQGLKRLRANGCDVVLICPTGIPGELKAAKKNKELKRTLKLARIERKKQLDQIRGLGVTVVDWNIKTPFSNVMAMGVGAGGRRRYR